MNMILSLYFLFLYRYQHFYCYLLIGPLISALEYMRIFPTSDFLMNYIVAHLAELLHQYPHFIYIVSEIISFVSRSKFTLANG